jgi:hypothetical protein
MGKPFDGVGVDWVKHLRPDRKKLFWRKVRHKIKQELKDYGKEKVLPQNQ